MATTTPNFGWSVPTSSDLVKNGAVAIETLGDSIDASMVDLKGGTTGQLLSKTSNTDMDFTWSTPSAGSSALTLISTTTLAATASTITFDSIASTYQNLQLIWNATGADDYVKMTFNNVTTTTYCTQFSSLSGTTFSGTEFLGTAAMMVGIKNDMSSGIIDIPNYKATTLKKTINSRSGRRSGTGTNGTRLFGSFGTNDATTAITRIDLTSDSVFGIGSSFSLYGVS